MKSGKNRWKKLSSRIAYENKYIKIREDEVIRPDGSPGIYSVVESPPSVIIIPLTDENEIYIIGQFRYPAQVYSWEIPGGNSDGQNLLIAAKRELQEEAGLTAKNWKELGRFQVMNGLSNEFMHVFLATGLKQAKSNDMAEEGIDELKKVSLTKAHKMIKSGEISDGQTIAALMLLSLSS